MSEMTLTQKRTIAAHAWDSLSVEDRRLTLHVLYILGEHLFESPRAQGLEEVRAAISPYATHLFSALPPLLQEALCKRVKGRAYMAPVETISPQPCTPEEEWKRRFWQGLHQLFRR